MMKGLLWDRMPRRTFLILLALLCVLATLFSCKSTETDARRLLIYTPHGQDMLRDFIARYQQLYPDASVQFLDMGAQDILARLRAERNRPQADLWWGAAHTTFQTAAEEELLSPFQPSWADAVSEGSKDPQHRWYGIYETPEVIVYNNEAVSAEEAPRDWDDVLGERWRGRVLIRNPNPSDSMRAIFGAMIWRFYDDTNSPAGGYDWLRRLDRNVREYTADGTILMQKLARQEGLVSLWNLPDVRLFKEQKGLPVDYVFPASGTPVIIDGIAIVRGGPNEKEARRFYEFVNTPENLVHAAHNYYRIPVRNDLERRQLPEWMNQPFARLPLDWELLRREGFEWLRYWDAEIRGRSK